LRKLALIAVLLAACGRKPAVSYRTEPVTRGPYTGALGYLGFNRESQLSIAIRTAICRENMAYFHAGAGIVADSIPAAEYDETIAKARGFLTALDLQFQEGTPVAMSS